MQKLLNKNICSKWKKYHPWLLQIWKEHKIFHKITVDLKEMAAVCKTIF